MSAEIDLLKRALYVLEHGYRPSEPISYNLMRDINKHLSKQTDPGNTSPCCGAAIANFRSFSKKVCTACLQEYEWPLKEGQQPLIKYTR